MQTPRFTAMLAALALAASALPALANGELNLYSSRHYDTDERLYTDFEAQTGVKINRIEAGASELMERMRAEGEASPADVFLTTDVGRIWRAEQAGLLQPVQSDYLESRIPAHLRDPDGKWFGFSKRARIIFYDRRKVSAPPTTYEELADPKYQGMICARSSSNIYMQSLLASVVAHHGVPAAEQWAKGLYANLARKPQGGDTDQLRGIGSGECAIAISNTYYFARLLSPEANIPGLLETIGWVFPNQDHQGTHVNLSAGAVAAHAPNRENAVRFLEYLASDSAQRYFSAGNNEYPAVPGVAISENVAKLGEFKEDLMPLTLLGTHQVEAQMIYDRVGYE